MKLLYRLAPGQPPVDVHTNAKGLLGWFTPEHIGGLGEAHIGDVAAAQIDLGRAAGALDQDKISPGTKPLESGQYRR